MSSVINSLAAVCLEDFVSPAVFYFKGVELSERIRRRTAVILGAKPHWQRNSVISVVVFQLQLQLQLFQTNTNFTNTREILFRYKFAMAHIINFFEISTYKYTKLHVTSFIVIVQCQSVTGTHCCHYSLHTSDTVTCSTCGCILEMHAFPDP